MALRKHPDFSNLTVMDHPLASHKLSLLRDKTASKKKCKELVTELSIMLAYEVTANLPLETRSLETPLQIIDAPFIAGKKPMLLPILRAGLGMVDGFLHLMPSSRVGHIGIYRDEDTLEPRPYFFKIPPSSRQRQVYVLDPMLATGGSASDALEQIQNKGLKDIRFICLFAAPEGVRHLEKTFPDVPVLAGVLDERLNEKGYILPGMGDAGDRLFGTK